MILYQLLILLLTVLSSQSVQQVYLGDNVTLPSGANPSLTLSEIEWSIWSNKTWIATYRDRVVNVNRFWQYKGRLSLNTLSGDLLIRNVSTDDARDYRVKLNNAEEYTKHVTLKVRKRLRKPIINAIISVLTEGKCLAILNCSSADDGILFTWQDQHFNNEVTYSSLQADNHSILVSFSANEEVTFTCNISKDGDVASNNVTARCNDSRFISPTVPNTTEEKPQLEQRERFGFGFVVGFALGLLVSAIIYIFKDRISQVAGRVGCPLSEPEPVI